RQQFVQLVWGDHSLDTFYGLGISLDSQDPHAKGSGPDGDLPSDPTKAQDAHSLPVKQPGVREISHPGPSPLVALVKIKAPGKVEHHRQDVLAAGGVVHPRSVGHDDVARRGSGLGRAVGDPRPVGLHPAVADAPEALVRMTWRGKGVALPGRCSPPAEWVCTQRSLGCDAMYSTGALPKMTVGEISASSTCSTKTASPPWVATASTTRWRALALKGTVTKTITCIPPAPAPIRQSRGFALFRHAYTTRLPSRFAIGKRTDSKGEAIIL